MDIVETSEMQGPVEGLPAVFSEFLAQHPETPDSIEKKKSLEGLVLHTAQEPSAENKQLFQETFPTGNYLIHGVAVESALQVVADGSLKSVSQQLEEQGDANKNGGLHGISFSYNGLGAFPGTEGHMTFFVTSPEKALVPGSKLSVPYFAAQNEVQLVDKMYDRQKIAQLSEGLVFSGFSSGLSDEGVFSNFFDLEKAIANGSNDSSIQKDLEAVAAGTLTLEELKKYYEVVEGKIVVRPGFRDKGISAGVLYLDYLLSYTTEGQESGKSLESITPSEALAVYDTAVASGDFKAFFKNVKKIDEEADGWPGVSVPTDSMVLVVPEGDVSDWLEVLSRVEKIPMAIISCGDGDGPKAPRTIADHNEVEKNFISDFLTKCGVVPPSLPFSGLVGQELVPSDVIQNNVGYLRWDTIKDAKEVVLSDEKQLELV